MLEKINGNHSAEDTTQDCERKFYANERLLTIRSTDDFARSSRKKYQMKNTTIDSLVKNSFESIVEQSIFSSTRSMSSDLSEPCPTHDAAIIDFEHQSLGKSSSSPLPINTNHSSTRTNVLQSAHLIHPCLYENQNAVSVQSCLSEMGTEHSSEETSSSDGENVERSLLKQDKEYLRHRWSLLDIWNSTKARLPPALNHIWRKHLGRTGSKEYREFIFIFIHHSIVSPSIGM